MLNINKGIIVLEKFLCKEPLDTETWQNVIGCWSDLSWHINIGLGSENVALTSWIKFCRGIIVI